MTVYSLEDTEKLQPYIGNGFIPSRCTFRKLKLEIPYRNNMLYFIVICDG